MHYKNRMRKFNPFRYLIWSQSGRQQQENFIKKPYERILSKCSFPAFPWRSFLKIRLTDIEIDELEDFLGYETSMNFGACEIPIDKHDLMNLTGTTYFENIGIVSLPGYAVFYYQQRSSVPDAGRYNTQIE